MGKRAERSSDIAKLTRGYLTDGLFTQLAADTPGGSRQKNATIRLSQGLLNAQVSMGEEGFEQSAKCVFGGYIKTRFCALNRHDSALDFGGG